MSSTLVSMFTDSLDAIGVSQTRTQTADFQEKLTEAVTEPAVGTPLPFEGITLEDTTVTVPPTPGELQAATTGVTPASGGIAAYGSVVVESRPAGDELVALYPERHVVVLRESDLVAGVDDTTDRLREQFTAGRDSAVLATGVSATADMGATIEGVHGPRDVHVLVLTDQ